MALAAVGVGSFAFHATLTLGVALLVALGVLLWLWPESRRVLFAAVLLPGIVLELVAGRSPDGGARWLHLGLGLLVTAYALWLLDQAGVLCDPTSWLQGHAAWHVLGAAAGWCLARHWAARRLVA